MAQRSIAIKDLRKFVFISDPQTSPDGTMVAYVHTSIDYMENDYVRHIWVHDVASGENRQFTFGSGKDTNPRWSPDGMRRLFLSRGRQPESKTQLYAIGVCGGEASLVADLDSGVSNPKWSPDGKTILRALFKAGVSCRSTCNRHSHHGYSDFGFNHGPSGNMGYPWKDEEKLQKSEPIRFAKNVKTPPLFIHNENDLRCTIQQAEEFFVALMELGVDTKLVRFPDENHKLSRSGKPKHREERFMYIMRWFDKYLK